MRRRSLVAPILEHSLGSPNAEVCGLVGASAGQSRTCYPVTNSAADRTHRFEMDPREQIAAIRDLRKTGETLLPSITRTLEDRRCPHPRTSKMPPTRKP